MRKCLDCAHRHEGQNSEYSYCKADREMRLETECEDYNPKRESVIIVGYDAYHKVRQQVSQSTNLFKESGRSFVTTSGTSYELYTTHADMRGRRANSIIVDKSVPLKDYIDSILCMVDGDFSRISVI